MKNTMNVTAITTIAGFTGGIDLYLRNLRWALMGTNYRIIIQTFAEHKKLFDNINLSNIDFVFSNQDPKNFYYFWNMIDGVLEANLDNTDVFLFTEQDIFFTSDIADQILICKQQQKILNTMNNNRLCVFDKRKKLRYPHIWEGGTLIPKEVIKAALSDGVNFGNHKRWLKDKEDKIEDLYTYNFNNKENFISIKDYFNVQKKSLQDTFITCNLKVQFDHFFDTMFEFTIWCYINKINTDIELSGAGHEYGDYLVHFRGVEAACRMRPNIINNIYEIFEIDKNKDYGRLYNDCFFIFFINNICEENLILKMYLKHNYKNSFYFFKTKINKLFDRCSEWMREDEVKKTKFCKNFLDKEIMLI
jgi:hypothetical protein